MISKQSYTQLRTEPKYSFLGWTITLNVRRDDAFNAAQGRAAQRKLKNDFLPISQQSPPAITSLSCEGKQHLPFWNVSKFTFQQATNPAVHTNLKICFIQLSGKVQPNLPHLYENMNLRYTIFMWKKPDLGEELIPTRQNIKYGIDRSVQ